MITDLFRPFIEIKAFTATTPEEEDIALCLLTMYDNGLLKIHFNEDEEPTFALRDDITEAQFESARKDYLECDDVSLKVYEC
jgi:hypothetical protein